MAEPLQPRRKRILRFLAGGRGTWGYRDASSSWCTRRGQRRGGWILKVGQLLSLASGGLSYLVFAGIGGFVGYFFAK
jgi:hypothetical protein